MPPTVTMPQARPGSNLAPEHCTDLEQKWLEPMATDAVRACAVIGVHWDPSQPTCPGHPNITALPDTMLMRGVTSSGG